MKDKCNIVKDLLPSYIDGLTSRESNEFIKEHIRTCNDCKEEINKYKSIEIKEKEETLKSIDYMKKPRKKLKGVIALFSIIILSILIYLVIPKKEKSLDFTAFDYNIVNDHLVLNISSLSSNMFLKLKEEVVDDTIYLQTYTTPVSSFGSYNLEYNLNDKGNKTIYLNDTLIADKGEFLNQNIIKLFENKIKYIGDNSGVSNILNLLNLNNFSPYTIEIQSNEEPYGLKINFSEKIRENDETTKYLNTIGKYIMALIDNCDYVTFSYNEGEYTIYREQSFDNELKAGYATSPNMLLEIFLEIEEN